MKLMRAMWVTSSEGIIHIVTGKIVETFTDSPWAHVAMGMEIDDELRAIAYKEAGIVLGDRAVAEALWPELQLNIYEKYDNLEMKDYVDFYVSDDAYERALTAVKAMVYKYKYGIDDCIFGGLSDKLGPEWAQKFMFLDIRWTKDCSHFFTAIMQAMYPSYAANHVNSAAAVTPGHARADFSDFLSYAG